MTILDSRFATFEIVDKNIHCLESKKNEQKLKTYFHYLGFQLESFPNIRQTNVKICE